MRTAAFFDMDHTVLRRDTGMSWMRFLRRRGELTSAGMARAVWWSLLYKAAVLDMEALATRLCAELAGEDEGEMIAKCEVWYAADVAPMVTPAARHAVAAHRAAGDVVVLATGATQYAALAVARGLGIEHTLCSRLEVDGGRFTGRLAAMCFGPHKVTLAERFAAEHGIDLARSTFYSDSFNDLPMLERVGGAVAVNPDVRLWRHARRRGWRIEQWA
ncbi:MAG: HAD-IB family hydrolase [Deltaproteobacteria bacterium]|nr:HAD-IB family hydrolase [Kofleriaceae bacterium]